MMNRARCVCLCAGIVLAACSGGDPSPATPSPAPQAEPALAVMLPPVTPDAIAGQLHTAASLDEAAEQVATALQIMPEQLRVRIQRDGCSVCALEENRENTSVEGITLLQARARLQPDDQLYLFVSRFACIFHYDGRFFTPQECRRIPI